VCQVVPTAIIITAIDDAHVHCRRAEHDAHGDGFAGDEVDGVTDAARDDLP
jgi:hypothetical protein